jgi:hypothetical protein
VVEQEAALAQIQMEFDRQKPILEAAAARLCSAAENLFRTKAILAKVQYLPAEILGEIFTHHVRGNLQSPFILMHVCKTWRSVALTTRAIWGAILITPPAKGTETRPRVIAGRQVCTKESQVRRALARAATTPLDLQIDFNVKGRARPIYKQRYVLDRLLGSLTRGTAKIRIRSLHIDTGFLGSIGSVLDRFDFRDIESLYLAYPDRQLVWHVERQQRCLRRLTILAKDIQPWVDSRCLPQLEHLEMQEERLFGQLDGKLIRRVLLSTRSLSSLVIQGRRITDEKNMEPRIDMPGLISLSLHEVSAFWPIECPNLTHLTMRDPRLPSDQIQPNSIHLPHLRFFSFSSFQPACLRSFMVPALRDFELESSGGAKKHIRREIREVWNEKTAPNINPIKFRFHHTSIHHKAVAGAISQMSLLEELTIESMNIGTKFLEDLHPKLSPNKSTEKGKQARKKSSPWIVVNPKIKVLRIDLGKSKAKTEEACLYISAAEELLEKRRNAKAPLERIEVRLAETEGWMIFYGS